MMTRNPSSVVNKLQHQARFTYCENIRFFSFLFYAFYRTVVREKIVLPSTLVEPVLRKKNIKNERKDQVEKKEKPGSD